jgi:hypothetical protein
VVAAGALTFPTWRGWVLPARPVAAEEHPHEDAPERVHLSPQARDNLRLVVQPLRLQT